MADPMLLTVGVLACSGSSIISSLFAPLMMSVLLPPEIPTDNDDPVDASTPDASTPVDSTPVDSTPPPPSGWCTGNRRAGRVPHRRDHCKTITSQSDCLSSELTFQSQWDDSPYPHSRICKWNPNNA